MKAIKKIILTLVVVALGIMLTIFLNFYFIQKIIIPNPEKYGVENIQTNKLFDLFYEISSNTGCHPDPTRFNGYITLTVGIILGTLTAYKLIWKTNFTENKIDKTKSQEQ